MPIYDYLCSNCRHVTEVIHGINEEGPRFCPACGADGTMRKTMSTPAVHFKGSGWATKDRSSSSGTRTKASASSSNDSGGSAAKDAGKDSASESSGTSTDASRSKDSSASKDSSGSKED